MQFSITVPINNKISEISRNAPSKSPVIPPKILTQILDQIIKLKIKIAGINIDFPKKINAAKKIPKKKLSRFRLHFPNITASPSLFANGRLFKIKAVPKRE